MKKEEIKNVDAFALMQAIAMAQEEKREKEKKQNTVNQRGDEGIGGEK
jgi:hypothetical protein